MFRFIFKLENWLSNPEQFVQDEDDESYSYSIRISAEELIEVNRLFEIFYFYDAY